jgi:hypothetical protein
MDAFVSIVSGADCDDFQSKSDFSALKAIDRFPFPHLYGGN